MLKLVKICGRQQLESVFFQLGPINNPADMWQFIQMMGDSWLLLNLKIHSHGHINLTNGPCSQPIKTSHPVSLKDPF